MVGTPPSADTPKTTLLDLTDKELNDLIAQVKDTAVSPMRCLHGSSSLVLPRHRMYNRGL